MKALYELLAKVGSNPKLRAWAMEQLINLKKLKPNYKKSFSHEMDLQKVKDIKNPNWLMEEITKAKGYNLKNKVVDITKAKDKLKWDKVDKQRDKDKFYGVTGQVNTWLKKMKDEGIAWEKQIAKDDAWFNKLIKAEIKGDIRAKKILDDYFKKQKKDFADKIIPFKPKKAEGGIITVSDPGMGDGPFMMEEFLEAVKQGFKGTYDEYIDQIDRSPRDYLAEGGVIEEVWDKKGIEDAKESLEGMKPHLMEESYIQLLDFLDSKQKELDTDIMESAGGLGEMLGEGGVAGHSPLAREQLPSQRRKKHIPHKFPKLGEGGRVGMQGGGWPGMLAWLAQQGPKVWKWMNKPGNNPYDLYKKYLKSVKERSIKGDMKSLAPEMGALTAGGIMANRWVSKKLKEATNLDRLNFAEEQIEELKKDQFYSERPELLEERINEIREDATRERKWWDKGGFNDGGRVGMMYGGDPGFAFSYGGSWADWKDNHASEMPLMDYINQKLPKARNPFSDSKYNSGGPVHELDGLALSIFQKPYAQLTASEQSALDNFKPEPYEPIPKAEGGRIGLAGGMSAKRIDSKKRDNYFRFNRDNYMNLFEYLQSEQAERDLEGAFKKGGKVKKGGIGDLLGEMYRLFEIGPLLGSPELMNIIQNIPFEKGGRVGFKKGQKVDLDRRMILKGIGALAAWPAFKWLKFAKTKPVKDISVKLKSWIDDSDEMTEWGPQATGRWAGNFDISSLTPQGVAILKKLFGKNVKTVKDKSGKITASMDDVGTEDAAMYVDDIIKKGKGVIDFKYVDDIVGGTGSIDATLARYAKTFGKNSKAYKDLLKKSKKMTEKQKIQYELDEGYDPYVDDVLDLVYPGKGEGGSVGYPPLQPNQKPQGPFYETNNPNEAFKEILRRSAGSGIIGAPIGGEFSLDVPYGQYGEGNEIDFGVGFNTDPRSSGFSAGYGVNLDGNDTMGAVYNSPDDSFNIGVRKQEGSDPQWKFEKKWKFAKGGKAWRPKSAPKLTTTIPPERGPTPQGLTYLTGDDIVQNIG
jgi:hypothetical protein